MAAIRTVDGKNAVYLTSAPTSYIQSTTPTPRPSRFAPQDNATPTVYTRTTPPAVATKDEFNFLHKSQEMVNKYEKG